jgi:hypothetical protein
VPDNATAIQIDATAVQNLIEREVTHIDKIPRNSVSRFISMRIPTAVIIWDSTLRNVQQFVG